MADNKDEASLGITPDTTPENIFTEPVSADKAATNNIPNQATTTMEVHHHPDLHHKTKKWKEYFLEFIMIFLAVTMGFIAENIRETISENAKAKEYAESLYKEVYADSVTMEHKLELRFKKETELEYYRKYVLDSNLAQLSPHFYISFAWSFILTTSIIFEPNDGILSELKSSGSQRYFKNVLLRKNISDINIAIANIRSRNSQEYSFVEDYTRPFTMQFYDFGWEDEFTQNGKLSILEAINQKNFQASKQPVIKNIDQFNKSRAESLAAYYLLLIRATRQLYYNTYKERNRQLLNTLRNQYHFE